MIRKNKKIASFYSLDVEMVSEATEEIRSHLRQMTVGTPGKLQYRFLDIDEKLSFLKNCRFLILKKSGRMIGSVCLIRRKSPVTTGDYSFWYVWYMYIHVPLKPKTYEKKKRKREDPTQLNYLWNSVVKYFEQPEIMLGAVDTVKQSLLYAYIPKSHLNSSYFSSGIGILPVKTFSTYFFSRTRPKKNIFVRPIREEEKEQVIKLLRAFYEDHILYFEENLFYKEQYYVFVKDNEIVAGVQANPEVWKFLNKPGVRGFLSRLLPSEEIDICARFPNWQKEEVKNFIHKPAYISCFDTT